MRSVWIAAACGVLSATLAGPVEAGQYELHSCSLPDGTRSPIVDWTPNGGDDERYKRSDSCLTAGYFDVRMLPDATQTGDPGRHWRLVLPSGIRARRMRGHFAATSRAGGHVIDAIAGNGLGNQSLGFGQDRGSLNVWNDSANAFDTGAFTATGTYLFGTRCAGGATCLPFTSGELKAYIRVFRAQATLEDLSIPAVDSMRGRLVESGIHRGVEGFALDASDDGAGVYRLIVELDGTERLAVILDPSAGQCADRVPGNGSDYDFTTATPCLPRVSGSRTLDTRMLPNGDHTLRLLVEDAAGNRRVAAGPVDGWRVDNRPVPGPRFPPPTPPSRRLPPPTLASNGVPASERSRLELYFLAPRSRQTCRFVLDRSGRQRRRCARVRDGIGTRRGTVLGTPYGRRVRLAGRLMTLDGRPIRGAQLHLRRARRGTRRPLERFDVRTDSAGRFRTTLGRSPSERIRAVYYATSASRHPVRSRQLKRLVPAGVAVRAARRGTAVVLSSRLYGGSRPPSGVRVQAEVRLGERWMAFARRRVRSGAWFAISRRFARTRSVRLRLRVLRTAGYPYEPSVSSAVMVRAGG